MRADVLLVLKGLAPSRQKAQELIRAKSAFCDGIPIKKPSQELPETKVLHVDGCADFLRYVGRGGLKLEGAFKTFPISVEECVCLDLGASTGGFTDCLLQNGAACVYAVDVGHTQLAEKLQKDLRVVNLEGINLRDLSEELIPQPVDFLCTDVSFISLSHVFPVAAKFLKQGGQAVFLIKPQFEAGKSLVGKNGIVKSRAAHRDVLVHILSLCEKNGFSVYGLTPSPICGADGNIEYLLFFGKGGPTFCYTDAQLKALVAQAFDSAKNNK